jgi:hypothetical protein
MGRVEAEDPERDLGDDQREPDGARQHDGADEDLADGGPSFPGRIHERGLSRFRRGHPALADSYYGPIVTYTAFVTL